MFNENLVFVLDVDGVITSGHMVYSKYGKDYKIFGPDDFDALKELLNYMDIHFITADLRGLPITQKRIEEEMNWKMDFVSGSPNDRWKWIINEYPNKNIIFMGDGIYDFVCLRNSILSITTNDALPHIKDSAQYITSRTGGNRAVAEACLYIMRYYNLDWIRKYDSK